MYDMSASQLCYIMKGKYVFIFKKCLSTPFNFIEDDLSNNITLSLSLSLSLSLLYLQKKLKNLMFSTFQLFNYLLLLKSLAPSPF